MLYSKECNLKMCFACAEIYESNNEQTLVCPNCGNKIEVDKYELFMRDAREAVYFGWEYRLKYEKELEEKGRIDTHYYLEQCEEIFNFIALAVASGIVGGFAYDVVKKVIRKIADFVKHKGNKEEKSKIFDLIEKEENMKLFIQYIDEYYTCFENINEEVRNAIFEEMVVDKMSATLENIIIAKNPDIEINKIKEINPFSEEEMFRSMIEVRRDIDNRKKLKSKIFDEFWENIEK